MASAMGDLSLSRRDLNVLEKIKDPESDPTTAVVIDPSLPRDPQITDSQVYDRVSRKEREIIMAMQQLEMQIAGLKPLVSEPVDEYRRCVASLGELITQQPQYASARNNRAQALRRLHGDTMLLQGHKDPRALIKDAEESDRAEAAATALGDLDEVVKLLTPRSLYAGMSPQACKTLSMAHTQRAAIYYTSAKMVANGTSISAGGRVEESWSKIEFEERASRDFAMGGRYGNEVAKGLAVATNPTAKLCGQIVREAMKKEYGPGFEA
ncbi:uncharacterized protein B0I36DRAFT_344251 [Microdochium trichocladiopsis]|uniref:Tetratricopeptide repeat protein 36 n=1 Tax=Microdochium trichocladiopsis TaxID=1682393 RepID=A0A9P8YHB8_9PEZI|nr:uncharacterized protein B0I36DRAFT_344251 [Microdochium trichocladiopsis]KAH7040521.1 hypothetical protein B0I36DRAFT_344251 [Microdochium trichocladiopsis]